MTIGQMADATTNALARTMGACPDRAKFEDDTVAGRWTEPQIMWPRNNVGEHATIAALMSETTETERQRCATSFAIRAGIWIRYAANRHATTPHSLRAKLGFLASKVNVSRSQFGATHE
ncbi:MAG TPA: hypothetical protein VMB73_08265 [Acetobacteraceae bacterium]|jgi:hypothetical protein|nr:hypothetical protein [Acetobacteraceae bacterium]